jgi:hypothetical protein
MAKRATATSVEYVDRDETGGMVSFSYTCPHCGYGTGEFIFVGPTGLDALASGFETDQVCGVCDRDVTMEVPSDLY